MISIELSIFELEQMIKEVKNVCKIKKIKPKKDYSLTFTFSKAGKRII